MQNNICPECETENEPEYQYCKNCGNPLFEKNPQPVISGINDGHGSSTDEIYTFVGKNAPKIVPKFENLQSSGTKVSWCWPPFIFGFFFGPIGAAVWFLYRKMYSAASVFATVGIAANYIMFALNRFFHIGNSTNDMLQIYLENYINGDITTERLFNILTDKQVIITFFTTSVYSSLNIACAVIAGIFGIYFYKKHTQKTITRIKSTVTDQNFVKFALASKGGISVGAVVVGLLIVTFLSNIPETVSVIIKALEVAF